VASIRTAVVADDADVTHDVTAAATAEMPTTAATAMATAATAMAATPPSAGERSPRSDAEGHRDGKGRESRVDVSTEHGDGLFNEA
jgi:hypothetical protein